MKRNQKAIKGISIPAHNKKQELGLLLAGSKGIVVDTSEECYNGGIVIQVIR